TPGSPHLTEQGTLDDEKACELRRALSPFAADHALIQPQQRHPYLLARGLELIRIQRRAKVGVRIEKGVAAYGRQHRAPNATTGPSAQVDRVRQDPECAVDACFEPVGAASISGDREAVARPRRNRGAVAQKR